MEDEGGWTGDYQAMYTLMKGLVSQGITNLEVGGNQIDWFDTVSDYIDSNQNARRFVAFHCGRWIIVFLCAKYNVCPLDLRESRRACCYLYGDGDGRAIGRWYGC